MVYIYRGNTIGIVKRLLILAPLLGGPWLHAAEFEVLDRFSVDGYSVLRGSADVPGGTFTVGGSTFVVKGGNVGIGTANPAEKLVVANGAGYPSASLSYSTSTAQSTLTLTKNTGNSGYPYDYTAALNFASDQSPNGSYAPGNKWGIRQYEAYNGTRWYTRLDFFDYNYNNAAVLSVLDTGNVGIGTANPGARLEVYSPRTSATSADSFILNDNVTGGQTNGVGKFIASYSNSGNSVSKIGFLETDGTNNNTSIAFYTAPTAGGLAERMRINQGGNVGIGTTAPAVKLDIDGTDAVRIPSGTTLQRPASPANGMMRLNTTTGKLEYYNNGGWNSVGGIAATGGTVSDSNGYRIHTFTGSGTFTVTGAGGSVEVEMLGGGGGGSTGNGQWAAGGGGAGYLKVNFTVTAGVGYAVTVGPKGLGQTVCDNLNTSGTGGGNSAFSTLSAYGGGRATQPTIAGIGGGFTTTGAASVVATGSGTNGNASTDNGGGGNNGGGVAFGTGAVGVLNGNPGNHASGNGNGGGGGHSCQGGHRGGGNGSDGLVIIRYLN